MRLRGNYSTPLFCYSALLLAVALWWFIAFRTPAQHSPDLLTFQQHNDAPVLKVHPLLTSIERSQLHQALAGNLGLMSQLISEWDIDAQILAAHGYPQARRLSRSNYLRAQTISRQMQRCDADDFAAIQRRWAPPSVCDSQGRLLYTTPKTQRYLPQTWVSASFLLALASPQEIVALPSGLRKQASLYFPDQISKIPLDINRYHAEKIYQAQPSICFVANYSDPAMLDALQNQGIQLFCLQDENTLDAIASNLIQVGQLTNHGLEAELMNIFIEASLLAIDNQLLVVKEQLPAQESEPRMLYLSYHLSPYAPTSKSLTGQHLARIGLLDQNCQAFLHQHHDLWMVPIGQEQLRIWNPDMIIIGTDQDPSLVNLLSGNEILTGLFAYEERLIRFINDEVQNSPTQYAVLGYFDLVHALAQMTHP